MLLRNEYTDELPRQFQYGLPESGANMENAKY